MKVKDVVVRGAFGKRFHLTALGIAQSSRVQVGELDAKYVWEAVAFTADWGESHCEWWVNHLIPKINLNNKIAGFIDNEWAGGRVSESWGSAATAARAERDMYLDKAESHRRKAVRNETEARRWRVIKEAALRRAAECG